jgi:hypothetical protein
MIFFARGSKSGTNCLERKLMFLILEAVSYYIFLIMIIGAKIKLPIAPIGEITQIPAH